MELRWISLGLPPTAGREPLDEPMPTLFRVYLWLLLVLALGFGFVHLVAPDSPLVFQRLHIFLFNLCAGGGLILLHAQGPGPPGPRVLWWSGLSLAYAVSAFAEVYPLTIALSVPLFIVVEQQRTRIFPWLPLDFLARGDLARKFQHASLLCLSLAILCALAVLVDAQLLHRLHYDKLTLDVFFLGYSFPLSLAAFSLLFADLRRPPALLGELVFWSLNLGVIAFFVAIILEVMPAEVALSSSLLATVCLVFVAYAWLAPPGPRKAILLSGVAFLVLTGISGVLYVVEASSWIISVGAPYLLTLHGTIALYGWNLSGLFIVILLRRRVVPTRRYAALVIGLQWLGVLLLTPIGKYTLVFAVPALLAFGVLTAMVLFGPTRREVAA